MPMFNPFFAANNIAFLHEDGVLSTLRVVVYAINHDEDLRGRMVVLV